ncbi:hypothetical protein SAMN04488512_101360 [Sulfitobacter litoralis]|uniref:Uncharacterized protein n=1 Tax=Sulfitobacter litoralis TaxID=335975 RepID=A0ABY0RKN0_9RHOB|nr:hypothetical protein SAMN04488512_101360 [Sulfitobacter litoralis]
MEFEQCSRRARTKVVLGGIAIIKCTNTANGRTEINTIDSMV